MYILVDKYEYKYINNEEKNYYITVTSIPLYSFKSEEPQLWQILFSL